MLLYIMKKHGKFNLCKDTDEMRTRDNKLTFSIRKLTIGAVSVMFGALIFGVSTSQAQADTVDNNQTTATPASAQASQAEPAASEPAGANETTNTGAGSTNTPASDTSNTNNSNEQNEVDHVNINDWTYTNLADGNVEVKSKEDFTYTGDVVIPNTADLINAGIITDPNGKAYIANGTLQNIAKSNGVTSITISKNGNSKLYVKDTTLAYAFANSNGENPALQKLDVGALDVSNVTILDHAFQLNGNLIEIDGLENWDVSHVTTMINIFYNDSKLTSEALKGIANWDTENLEILHGAFYSDPGLTNLDFLKNWNVSKLSNMVAAFSYDGNLTDISALANWHTDSLQDIFSAFIGTGITNLDALRNWNTSKLISMGAAFWATGNLSDISGIANWDVSKVTNFASTFLYDDKIQGLVNLSNWEISDNADANTMFFPRNYKQSTPLMVIVKSGAENINKAMNNNNITAFGLKNNNKYFGHYLYQVEINDQIVDTIPTKAFNSASEAVSEIQNHLNEIAQSKNLSRDGYTFSWQGVNPYGDTGAYQLYKATWTPIPTPPVNPDEPDVPDQPVTPDQPDTPDIPAPLPDDKPDEPDDNKNNGNKHHHNGGTVKPNGEQANHSSLKGSSQTAVMGSQSHQHVAQDKLPQTGEKASVGIWGLALASLGLLGLAVDRKRKNK